MTINPEKLWKLLEEAVGSSYLNKTEKKNVITELDIAIGKYFLDDKLPVVRNDLTENEFVVYKELVEAINGTSKKSSN